MRNVILGAIICTILAVTGFNIFYYSTKEYVKVTVEDKERIVEGSGEDVTSRYIIYTDSETFQNVDDLFIAKFNSSDLYNDLKVDSTYTIQAVGWRIPFLSSYRNITKINNGSK